MTASERDTLRGVIDAAKRARLARAGNPYDPDYDRHETLGETEKAVRLADEPSRGVAGCVTDSDWPLDHRGLLATDAPPSMVPVSPNVLVADLAGEKPRPVYRGCAYCGRPTYGYACKAHRDLPRIERQLIGAAA